MCQSLAAKDGVRHEELTFFKNQGVSNSTKQMWESSPELCRGCDVSGMQSMVSQLGCLGQPILWLSLDSELLLCLIGSELQVSDSLPCE